ncbi:MAG: TlpA disulfide reductase family protein [Smithella sp.]
MLKIISLILVLFMNFYPVYPGFAQENRATQNTNLASDFTLKDFNGKNYRLRNYKGKVILLNFMTTWCPECKSTIPYLKSIHTKFNQAGLIVLNISVMQNEEKVAAFSKKYSLPYPTLLDRDGKIAKDYGVVGVPVKVLIDRESRIICWNCPTLDKIIENQFAGKSK